MRPTEGPPQSTARPAAIATRDAEIVSSALSKDPAGPKHRQGIAKMWPKYGQISLSFSQSLVPRRW